MHEISWPSKFRISSSDIEESSGTITTMAILYVMQCCEQLHCTVAMATLYCTEMCDTVKRWPNDKVKKFDINLWLKVHCIILHSYH